MFGIDVSTHNGSIDWHKVKSSNVDFAMIKATQGRGESVATRLLRRFTDGKFKKNVEMAHKAGVPFGTYHYLTAHNPVEAVQEAEYFCRTIRPYLDKMSLWAAVDVESVHLNGIDKEALAEIVNTFCEVVREHGFKTMVYTNPNYLKYKLPPDSLSDHDIWLAHWGVYTPYAVKNMKIWQYGSASVNGIYGKTDANNGYFSIPLDAPEEKKEYKTGDKYTVRAGDTYSNGNKVPDRLIGREFTVSVVSDGKILLKEIYSWINI